MTIFFVFFQFLKNEGLTTGILEYLQAEIETRLRVEIVPDFWKYFLTSSQQVLNDTEKAEVFQKVRENKLYQ